MKRVVGFAALTALLVSLVGCDDFSLLSQFSRNAPLALTLQYRSLQQAGTTALYPSGGVPPYTFGVVAGDLFYPGTSIGSVANGVYTAGDAIGTVEITVTDSIGEIAKATETIIPPAPQIISVTASSSPGQPQVQLTWSYGDTLLISGFEIWRSTNGASFSLLSTTPLPLTPATTNYADTSVKNNTTYWYEVRADAGGILSLPTPARSATP